MEIFLDIEASSLKGDIGQIVAIGIIKNGKKEVKFVENLEDEKNSLEWLKNEIKDCETVITWYGSSFDLPFILTRALVHGVDLSELEKINSLDLCEICRKKFLFSKKNLSDVAKVLSIKKDDEISGKDVLKYYMKAIKGDEKAREVIIKHCLNDLEMLEEIYKKVKPYLNLTTKNP